MLSFKGFINEKYVPTKDLISWAQVKQFEKIANDHFKKYNLHFDFTPHFNDRMSDERNAPPVSMKELGIIIQKIYKDQAKSLKDEPDIEAVLKQIETNINIPIAIEYDRKKDHFRIAMKTVMRKKNFYTKDKVIEV